METPPTPDEASSTEAARAKDATPSSDAAPSADPAGVVEALFRAFEECDAEAALALVADDIAYANVSLPTVYGRPRLAELMRLALRPGTTGFRVHFNYVMSEGDVVLTDRVDEVRFRRFVMRFWVYGRFVVRDGLITLWRDSFDWFDLTVAALRGLAGLLSPGLNRRMPGDRAS